MTRFDDLLNNNVTNLQLLRQTHSGDPCFRKTLVYQCGYVTFPKRKICWRLDECTQNDSSLT